MTSRISIFSFLIFLILMLSTGALIAQGNSYRIHPELQIILLNTPANEFISVYATLQDQYPLENLREAVHFMTKKERQKEVVRNLKNFTAIKQENVINFLKESEREDKVNNINVLWAANTIIFNATPGIIYSLAENFGEIAEIRYSSFVDEKLLTDLSFKSILSKLPQDGIRLEPQQGLVLINAPAVWAEGDSGKGILVGNLDTGCDWDHPDLIHNIWNNLGEDNNGNNATVIWNGSAWVFDPGDVNGIDDDNNGYIDDFIGWDFTDNNNDPYNSSSTHGTHTTGIVCGDGTNGTQTGVAPRTKILILRPNGEAQYWLGQQYCIDKGVDIVTSSLSYKWYFSPQPNYPMFRQMTDVELAAGIVHTNSTSNDGNSLGTAPIPYNISAPGNCPPPWLHPDQTLTGGLSSVIGAGNVDAFTDIIVGSSPHGPAAWENIQIIHPGYPYPMPSGFQDYPYETQPGAMGLLKPDVSAPGANTVSTTNGGGYSSFSGTSGSTPHVAGTVALMLSINPELLPGDVARIIQLTSVEKGTPGKDNRYGAGRIDAYEAFLQARSEIPVELTSFVAAVNKNNIILNWQTASETNNQGFEIERSEGFDFKKIGFIPGHGTTTEAQSYIYTDENILTGKYTYRLKQLDFNGAVEYSNVVKVDMNRPHAYNLNQNYPNPFNPITTISYSIPDDGFVSLKIFDVLGNEVKILVNEIQTAGNRRIVFDASELSSGVYYFQLVSGDFSSTRKLILLK
jgi:subtilisin family serine protease